MAGDRASSADVSAGGSRNRRADMTHRDRIKPAFDTPSIPPGESSRKMTVA